MKERACKKILSLLLAAVLATTGLGGALQVTSAYAAGTPGAANDGIDFDALTGNGIYYGTYDHATSVQNNNDNKGDLVTGREGRAAPILWNVMGEEGTDGKLALLSKYVLDTKQFYFSTGYSGANAYNQSVIRNFLTGGFMNSFTVGEQAAMATTQVVTGMYDFNTGAELTGMLPYQIDPFPLTTNDKVYLPWGRHYDGKVHWTAGNDISGGGMPDNTATLKNGTGVSWRLRSADSRADMYGANSALIVDFSGNIDGSNVVSAFGVRPVFKLNPSSVIFASEIVSSGGDGMGTIAADPNYTAAGDGAQNYKLTILNDSIKLDSLNAPGGAPLTGSGETLTIAPMGTLALTGTISGGAEKLAYKIVDRSGGGIVGYCAGNATNVSVASAKLTQGGSYTLYVWAQKDNEKNSNEASQPMYFTLNVQEPSAPTITGPTSMTLAEGYAAASTDVYTLTGTTPIMVRPSDSRFIWDTVNQKLNIPDGLAGGSYVVTLTAGNGTSPDAKLDFTLTVTSYDTGDPDPAYILRTLHDSATGIRVSGRIHRRATLAVRDMTLGDDPACEAIRTRMDGGGLVLLVGQDISLSRGFTGSLTITIPLPIGYNGETVTILHCANGVLKTYTTTVTDGEAMFTVTSLSSFAIFQSGITVPDTVIANPPKTGDERTSAGFAVLALAALCGAVAAMKRRKV